MEFLITVLGLVLVVEGIPWFISPRKVKVLLRQMAEISDSVLRFSGLAAMLTGLLLVWLATR